VERIKTFRPAYIAAVFFTVFSIDSAADVQISGMVEASLIDQSFDTESTNSRYQDRSTLRISPTVIGTYSSKKARLSGTASHIYQRFDTDVNENSTTYTEFNYSGGLSVIDNIFQIFGQGRQGYQSYRANSYISSDYLLNADDLTKVTSHSVGARLNVPTGNLLDMSISGSYFETKSDNALEDDETTDSPNRFIDSTGFNINANINNGSWFQNSYWRVNSFYRRTDRQQGRNFDSLRVDGEAGYNIYGDLAFMVTASHEENNVDDDLGNFSLRYGSQFSRFDTYGAGINYRPASSRFISLSVNKVSTEGDDDGKTFVGLSTRWQFSPRTNIQANYGRRYYGDSGNFTFNYGTKRVRSSVTYQESTTTFSNLIFDTVDAGTFVCPAGAVDIIDCFQPDTLDYELNPGEQVVQFSQLVSELTDQVILRRQLGASIGFQKRRLKASIDARYIDTDYSVDNRQQIQKQVGISASLDIGRRSSLYSRLQFTQLDRELDGTNTENDTKIYSIGARSQLSRGLSVNADLRFLDGGRNRIVSAENQDLNETRVSLGLTYNFQSNRQ